MKNNCTMTGPKAELLTCTMNVCIYVYNVSSLKVPVDTA